MIAATPCRTLVRSSSVVCLVAVYLTAGCAQSEREPPSQFGSLTGWQDLDPLLWAEILAAEDRRADSPEGLDPILRATRSASAEMRRLAVSALGRMERVSLVPSILPLLSDSVPLVRAEAANALGQAVFRGDGSAVLNPLLDRLSAESDPHVRGVIAQTLGRLSYESPDMVRAVEAALVSAADGAATPTLLGVARGLESLVRREMRETAVSEQAIDLLRTLARYDAGDESADAEFQSARVRRLSLSALVQSGGANVELLGLALGDRDTEVRRLAANAAMVLDTLPRREEIVARAIRDQSGVVRHAALRAYGRRLQPSQGCGALLDALDDSDPDVALLAIDLLANDCGADREPPVERLANIASQVPPGGRDIGSHRYPGSWHRAAHALVALANAAPERAAQSLSQFATHESWWVRMYAARAAASMDSLRQLEHLAYDEHDNVREAAIRGLSVLVGHDADSIYVEQLARSDYQLIISATRGLEGSPRPAAVVPPLLDALGRLTAERRETSRDVRLALIGLVGALGGATQAAELRPYLEDFDPVIADEAARIISVWTGRTVAAMPSPLPGQPLPSFAEVVALSTARLVLEMRGGGRIELRLLAFEAPTNAARFARLARSGYFDGLTFHRVIPGFVIQGGSPGANEFSGDGDFTRDELLAASHLRGTIGVSTRGRDTGDGQMFFNLVDNPRLDHNYTIFAEVVSGMEVVDGILEGATIERVIRLPEEGRN